MDKQTETAVVQKELGAGITTCRRWCQEIEEAKRFFKQYWKTCDDVITRYMDDEDGQADQGRIEASKTRKYNVLWSMTETQKPLIYSQPPQPYVRRRHSDRDPLGRDGGMLIQRGLQYELDGDELHYALQAALEDYVLCSRGVIWARYKPFMELRESEERTYLQEGEKPPKGADIRQDESGLPYYHAKYEAKVDEETEWDYVYYKNFLHGQASKWKYVPWVARMVEMTREEMIERFGEEIAKKIPLTINNKDKEGENNTRKPEATDDEAGLFAKAEVWEIWSKNDRKVRWLCPEYSKGFLDEQDDFLKLREFFPCPKPAFLLTNNRSLIPKPEYKVWQGVGVELDDITNRLRLLIQALRVAGVYDKSAGDDLKKVTSGAAENELIGVDNYAMFAERGGLKGMIEFIPIEQVVVVVERLYNARQQLLQELYDITGISDVVRGASSPYETAKAQQIKGNFAGKRIGQKQEDFVRMAREALEIQAQIMCEHYSDRQIAMVSSAEEILVDPASQQPDPRRIQEALQLIRSAPLRRYRIKVDEKSLAMQDIMETQEQTQAYLMGLSQLLQSATTMAKENPAAAPLMGELLTMGVRAYPKARSTEAAIEQAIEAMMKAGPPPQEQQPRGKPPEELQAEMQMFERKIALDERRQAFEEQKALKEYGLREIETHGQQKWKQLELDLKAQRDKGELVVRGEQVDVQRQMHRDNFALEVGKLQATTSLDLKKIDQDYDLKIDENQTKKAIESGKLLMQAEKDERDAESKERERYEQSARKEKSDEQYGKIMSGLQDIMAKSQTGTEDSVKALEKILQEITQQQETIMKTLTSPRKVVRNKEGKVERVEVDAA